ncbi:Cof-type HAD-IIB family hydrolase [Actinomadura sp. ATCC 31491]|uniref:Cof-type HAD-IIB family hydrolase n=1 Tax=Actinomadura luzonensis TaxID=2805427 RepID=A0ABT0FWX2_9ACTN|nr:Cof-type HAD-IIB family hydrolase [Actinomadura luzonensis]MCK2216832.1 Cof-type HAD-IIB family hydrolase [Actinomadura luzonensis]
MTSPRIVATDLDGTLLTSDRTVSPRTRDALRLAREAGAEIVFVTARAPRGVRPIAEQAGVTGTAICSNGAIVYDLATDEITESRPLDRAAVRHAVLALAEALPAAGLAVETGRGVLAEAAYTRRLPEDVGFYRDVASVLDGDEPIVKLLAHSAAHTADEMIAALLATLTGLAEITQSGDGGLVEISAPGVNKAAALDRLCGARGVGAGEVVAFGDMPNDLAVLTYAGLAYAMANAHPEVLRAVPGRTLSNDEDGVAAVLERLYG